MEFYLSLGLGHSSLNCSMKVLITGAGGMLGTDLAAALQDSFEVAGAGRSPAPHLRIPYDRQDLLEPNAVQKILERDSPDLVFHAAAMTNVDGCEQNRDEAMRLNVQLTKVIAEACHEAGAFLIFFSTDYVFDGSKQGEYDEDDAIRPLNVYGESKALAEKMVREHAERYTIFRISWLYGLRGKSFPRTILEKAVHQNEFQIVSDQMGRPTFTKDIAYGFRKLLTQEKYILDIMNGQTFHLANSEKTSWADFASFLLKQSGFDKARVKPIASEELTRPARRPQNSVLNLDKAESYLGLNLRPWQEAAVEFVQEFKGYRM